MTISLSFPASWRTLTGAAWADVSPSGSLLGSVQSLNRLHMAKGVELPRSLSSTAIYGMTCMAKLIGVFDDSSSFIPQLPTVRKGKWHYAGEIPIALKIRACPVTWGEEDWSDYDRLDWDYEDLCKEKWMCSDYEFYLIDRQGDSRAVWGPHGIRRRMPNLPKPSYLVTSSSLEGQENVYVYDWFPTSSDAVTFAEGYFTGVVWES